MVYSIDFDNNEFSDNSCLDLELFYCNLEFFHLALGLSKTLKIKKEL